MLLLVMGYQLVNRWQFGSLKNMRVMAFNDLLLLLMVGESQKMFT